MIQSITLFKKLLATPIFVETSTHSTLYWKNISQFILQSFLKPTIRYELKHGDMLTFGDVKCQYVVDLDTEEVKLYVHCEACLTELGKPTRDCKVGLYQQ